MRKNRGGLAKIGVLAIALMVALGALGIGYAAWTDVVNINAMVNMGATSTVLNCGSGNGTVSCSVDGTIPMRLNLDVYATAGGVYTRGFTIQNTGDIPVKIKSIIKDLSQMPAGVSVSVNGIGTVIDPGLTYTGFISVSINHGATLPVNFGFTVTFNIVLWNMP